MASEGLHERYDDLDRDTIERHRAWVSLREELEAIDWYDQRVHATHDDELRAILQYNRDDEKEHASLLLGWLAKRDSRLAAEIQSKVVRGEGPPDDENESASTPVGDGSLGIGSLRERT